MVTAPERAYFESINMLALLIPAAMTASRTDPLPEYMPKLIAGATACLNTLHSLALLSLPDTQGLNLLKMLASLHALSYFRDAAVAIKMAISVLVAFNDKEKEKDKSKTAIRKEIMADVSALDAKATKALGQGSAHVKLLMEAVARPSFQAQISSWAFGSTDDDELSDFSKMLKEEVGGETEVWAAVLAGSWRRNIKGWDKVKWA